MAKHTLVVLTNAKDGADDAFNTWYNDVHIGDVLALDGFSAAQRFKLSDSQMPGISDVPYGYLALYEIDTDDINIPLNALTEGAPAMEISDAFDGASASAWLFSPIAERVTANEAAAARVAT